MSDPIRKVTTLDSHYASGDCECFCFDRRTPKQVYAEQSAPGFEYTREYMKHEDECRVYPNVLLPETNGRKGRWVITIEFTPEDEPSV